MLTCVYIVTYVIYLIVMNVYSIARNFHQFPLLLAKILSMIFFSCIYDYMEDVVTFTILTKIKSMKYSSSTKVASFGKSSLQ